jgi:hypothetical protein
MQRSRQSLTAKWLLISLCLGTALRLFDSEWRHQEWLPPSRSNTHPFEVRCICVYATQFEGDVTAGERYVLVDDVISMGANYYEI